MRSSARGCKRFLLDERPRQVAYAGLGLVQHFRPAVAFHVSLVPPRIPQSTAVRLSAAAPSPVAENDGMQPPLKQCQRDCLAACAQGARVIEMACGTGKTRVIQKLVSNVSGRVPFSVDSIQFCEYQCNPLLLSFWHLFDLSC